MVLSVTDYREDMKPKAVLREMATFFLQMGPLHVELVQAHAHRTGRQEELTCYVILTKRSYLMTRN